MDPLFQKLHGTWQPSQYWAVAWSFDSATDDGTEQLFVGPYAEAEARAFAAALGVRRDQGYVRVRRINA